MARPSALHKELPAPELWLSQDFNSGRTETCVTPDQCFLCKVWPGFENLMKLSRTEFEESSGF